MTKGEKIYCERCGDKLNPAKVVWLELSQTDGKYYTNIPNGHTSQGAFSFGVACSKTQLKETWNAKAKEALTAAKLTR